MSTYQQEQIDALTMVQRHLASLSRDAREAMQREIQPYLAFRRRVDVFLRRYFSRTCTRSCFQSHLSACCSREGIITFFADVVVNALVAADAQLSVLLEVLREPNQGFKCIYLGPEGCRWIVKPIVCELFLCDAAAEEVFRQEPSAESQWKRLQKEAQGFKWPDRPVLFDTLEKRFLDAGCRSALMYLHTSPGLLRIKRQAGLATP
jgi:hypothetical protein